MVCELIYTILLYFFAGWMPLKTEHMVYVICIGCIIYIADGDHYIIKQICYTCAAHTSGCGKDGWLMAFELAYKSARCTYSAHNKPAKLWGLIARLCCSWLMRTEAGSLLSAESRRTSPWVKNRLRRPSRHIGRAPNTPNEAGRWFLVENLAVLAVHWGIQGKSRTAHNTKRKWWYWKQTGGFLCMMS